MSFETRVLGSTDDSARKAWQLIGFIAESSVSRSDKRSSHIDKHCLLLLRNTDDFPKILSYGTTALAENHRCHPINLTNQTACQFGTLAIWEKFRNLADYRTAKDALGETCLLGGGLDGSTDALGAMPTLVVGMFSREYQGMATASVAMAPAIVKRDVH